jgi:RNA polymerase sigma factor (sigma-70 family)
MVKAILILKPQAYRRQLPPLIDVGAAITITASRWRLPPFLFGFAIRRLFNSELKMTDSQSLLSEYVKDGSEPAFRELVARYVDLVYSAAVRLVEEDRHLAEDVAQTVFADLARMARRLPSGVMLGGWLHRHTCFVAATLLRGERRRRARERQAVEMNALQDHPEANLNFVASMLDEAINQLGAADRTAILLRFFEQRDFRSVGEALGSNEDAARMRVSRALGKLHSLLKRRGVTLSAAALGTTLAGQVVTAAPAGLAAAISSAALAGTATGTGMVLTTLKLMLMAKLKIGIVSAVIVASIATPLVLQYQARAKLREQDNAQRQQQIQLAALQTENQRLANLAAGASLSNNQPEELQRLRAEAAKLQAQTGAVAKLRAENRRLQASAAKLQTPLQRREEAISKMNFSKQWVLALFLYSSEHQDQVPTDFEQARPFLPKQAQLETNVTTDQFEITYQGTLTSIKNPGQVVILREKQAHQMPTGNWVKAYGFGDGHAEIHSEADSNFDAWEKQHVLAPASPGQ